MATPNNIAPEPQKLRLIVVDDEPAIRSGLVDLFPWDSLGYAPVGQFDNGQLALDFLRQNPVDVVLTDIRMPVMDGIALAKAIRAEMPKTQMVFLSSYTEFEYARQGLLLGVRDYIVKPVKYQVLIDTFTKLYDSLAGCDGADAGPAQPAEAEEIPAPYQGYYPEIVSFIKLYIEEHLATASLETVAAAIGYSPNYISRIFHKYAQVSFSEYLTSVRMKKAASLLCNINVRLYEVSQMVGYENQKSFSRAFYQFYGTTPTEFRK